MLKRIADFLLAKRYHAVLVIFALNIYPIFLPTLAMIAFAFIILKKGVRAGLFLLPWALLPYAAHALVMHSWPYLLFPVVEWGLMWVIASMLVTYESWVMLVQSLALLAVAVVLSFHLYVGDTVAWWMAHFQQYVSASVGSELGDAATNLDSPKMQLLLKITTGLQALLFAFSVAFKLVVARWWQATLYNQGGLKEELHHICLAKWMFVLLVIAAIGIAMKETIAVDAVIPILGAYVVAGVSLLHAWVSNYKYGFILLLLFYVAALLMPYLLFVVVLAAVFDGWFHYRTKRLQIQK